MYLWLQGERDFERIPRMSVKLHEFREKRRIPQYRGFHEISETDILYTDALA